MLTPDELSDSYTQIVRFVHQTAQGEDDGTYGLKERQIRP
jgi:hypothetical protein